jgi:hypothetical protein
MLLRSHEACFGMRIFIFTSEKKKLLTLPTPTSIKILPRILFTSQEAAILSHRLLKICKKKNKKRKRLKTENFLGMINRFMDLQNRTRSSSSEAKKIAA